MIALASASCFFFVAFPSSRICRRLGFPPLLGLLAIVPVAKVTLLFHRAFAKWPARPDAGARQQA